MFKYPRNIKGPIWFNCIYIHTQYTIIVLAEWFGVFGFFGFVLFFHFRIAKTWKRS